MKNRRIIMLIRERIEVGYMSHGRPSYRWTNGYYVCDDAHEQSLGTAKLYPPVRRKEAYALAREIGGANCKIVIGD